MSKSGLLPIERQVQGALQTWFGDNAGLPRFIIGVSGGPDSMCLLYIFKKLGVGAVAVHINYGKRGTESDNDAELVEEMAFQWGFDCQSLSADSAKAEGLNFQQWARSFRYDVFRALAAEYDADGIALAHHEDDQIETILQKVFRGAGIASWKGMQVWDGELFRPLLMTGRSEIEDYVEREAIPYRVDKSNLASDFARNFLRNEWLAELGQHFPGWKQNVLRISEQAALMGKSMNWVLSRLFDKRDRIDRKRFLELDPSLRRALILHKLKDMQPGIEISTDAIRQLSEINHLQTGKAIQLTSGLSLMRDRAWFKIVYEKPDPLKLIDLEQNVLKTKPLSVDGIQFKIEKYNQPDFGKALYLDAAKITWPLVLRRWKKGDFFQPFGMEGHQNLSDHLTNRKISASYKNKAMVLESFEESICAVIFPSIENRVPPGTISELVKCDGSTIQYLTIKRIS